MTTIRSTHDDDHPHFAIVRPTAQNKALSYEALGMLTYVLSQADDWVIGVDDLIREGCGRDKAYRILKELSEAGHLTRVRSAAGQHKPPVWANRVVYEQPFTEMPDLVKSSIEAPNPEKAELVKSSVSDARAQQQDSKALNTELKDQEIQELKDKDVVVVVETARVNIYKLYEANIGILTPMMSERLKLAEQEYPSEWIPEAFQIAVDQNKRNWAYVQGILENWRDNGFKAPRPALVKGAGIKTTTAPQKPVEVTPKGGVGLSWQQYQEVTGAKAK